MGDASSRMVDSWRFAGSFLQRVLSDQIPDLPTHERIPWTLPRASIDELKVALLSTAGISMKGDAPFDMEFERKRPTRGDPSWRALRGDASSDTIETNHLHIDTSYIERDINVALPVDRLRELVAAGEVGAAAETHYSIMGYQGNDAGELQQKSAPEIANRMLAEDVDLALLAPV